jgi:type IV secretory pathway VirB10-like protein
MASPQYAEYLPQPSTEATGWAEISLFASEYTPDNGTVWHFAIRRRTAVIVGIAFLLHAILLYFLLTRTNWIEKQKVRGEKVAMLYFPPAPPTPPAPPSPKRPEPKPLPQAVAKAKSAPPPTRTAALPPPPIIAQTITPPPQEEDDMMARIEAARKRRAQANAEVAPEEAEDENQRGLRIAKANFAASQRRAGNAKEDSGGVFQIRNLSYHSAEFSFKGWNATMRRMWPQNYEVQQGQEPDLSLIHI